MKIDYSKWTFTFMDSSLITLINKDENISTYIYLTGKDFDFYKPAGEDMDKHIKERCKQEIRNYYLGIRMRQLRNITMLVEDNLDYIETEAHRRGI